MEFQIDPQKVIEALSQRVASLTTENATLGVLLQDAHAAHAECAPAETPEV